MLIVIVTGYSKLQNGLKDYGLENFIYIKKNCWISFIILLFDIIFSHLGRQNWWVQRKQGQAGCLSLSNTASCDLQILKNKWPRVDYLVFNTSLSIHQHVWTIKQIQCKQSKWWRICKISSLFPPSQVKAVTIIKYNYSTWQPGSS